MIIQAEVVVLKNITPRFISFLSIVNVVTKPTHYSMFTKDDQATIIDNQSNISNKTLQLIKLYNNLLFEITAIKLQLFRVFLKDQDYYTFLNLKP